MNPLKSSDENIALSKLDTTIIKNHFLKEKNLFLLKNAHKKQKDLFKEAALMDSIDENPSCSFALCGTIPIGIFTVDSDFDIIVQCPELEQFERRVEKKFSGEKGFKIW